jgi:DNA-binding MarR family transcriptional regulator
VPHATDVDAVSRAIDQLLRLNSSRKVHARLSAASGVLVSQPGYVLLRRIHEDGPISLGELAQVTHMDPAAAGRQVRQLEAEGLVERRPGKADGRVTEVRVTRRGRDVRRRLTEVLGRHLEDALADWSTDDLATLAGLLARLVDDLRAVHYRPVDAA